MKNSNHLFVAATIMLAAITTGCFSESASNRNATVAKSGESDPTDSAKSLANDSIDHATNQPTEPTVPDQNQAPPKIKDAPNTAADADHKYPLATSPQSTTNPSSDDLPTLKEALENPVPEENPAAEDELAETPQTITIPDTWKRLGKKHEIWVDVKAKQVIAAGHICMRAGPLEVFACPRRTKEHESIVSLNALGSQIHAALLAIGAEPGHPVKWQEKYEPATGPVIHIDVIWSNDDKQQLCRAQELVTNAKTGKAMEENWVFGGSAAFTDEESGETYYYGDSGELVCLSNFSTATMDVPVKSSDANEGLLYQANTEKIPEFNTKVYLVFKPEIPTK